MNQFVIGLEGREEVIRLFSLAVINHFKNVLLAVKTVGYCESRSKLVVKIVEACRLFFKTLESYGKDRIEVFRIVKIKESMISLFCVCFLLLILHMSVLRNQQRRN